MFNFNLGLFLFPAPDHNSVFFWGVGVGKRVIFYLEQNIDMLFTFEYYSYDLHFIRGYRVGSGIMVQPRQCR